MAYEQRINISGYLENNRLPCYKKAWETPARYVVLMGGGGSGKSFTISQKMILDLVVAQEPMTTLVIRNVKEDHKESTFKELKMRIADYGWEQLFKINNSTLEITCLQNKNNIIFRGLDDIERVKSIAGVTRIWIEEASEISEGDFNQLDVRMRQARETYPLQILSTLNPISANHWLKARFFASQPDNAFVLKTTYKDNPYLPPESIKVLEDFKETSPYYYKVYCLGEWGTIGDTVFDREMIGTRLDEVFSKRFKRGRFTFDYTDQMIENETIEWVDDPNGVITLYEEPNDIMPYVGGADTAGLGIDYHAAHILNNYTGKIVAQLHDNVSDEQAFTQQLYCLGMWYNEALLNVERNYSTYPVMELKRLEYPRLYFTSKIGTIGEDIGGERYGFVTNKNTRNTILSMIDEYIREHIREVDSAELLDELTSFVIVETKSKGRKGALRQEAAQGAHDDLIMALGITLFTREQQEKYPRQGLRPEWKRNDIDRMFWGSGEPESYSIW